MSKARGLEIDRRVGIALSALSTAQQRAVRQVTLSPRVFSAFAEGAGRTRLLRTSGQPLYLMRLTPTLRLIYTFVGETIYVLDLVERETLAFFDGMKRGGTRKTTVA